jgi:hypothetical protein
VVRLEPTQLNEGGCRWHNQSCGAETPIVRLIHYSVAEHLVQNGGQVSKALGILDQPALIGHDLLLNAMSTGMRSTNGFTHETPLRSKESLRNGYCGDSKGWGR